MPISQSRMTEYIRQMEEAQRAAYANRPTQETAYATNLLYSSPDFNLGIDGLTGMLRPSSAPQLLLERRNAEKESLDLFTATGRPQGAISIYGNDGFIVARGYNIGDGKDLFVLVGKTLTMHKRRAKHLKKQLKALAERQGVELVEADSLSYPRSPALRTVYFYALKEGGLDDTELVSQTKVSTQGIPVERYYEHPEPVDECDGECCADDEDEDWD